MKERIKTVRKANHLTQEEFAERLGLKRGTIANYEVGRNEPIAAIVTSICREFNVNEEWLRYGTGEMHAETTHQQKLAKYFADVLATAPDERSAFIAALSELPPEALPMFVDFAKKIVENIKKEES